MTADAVREESTLLMAGARALGIDVAPGKAALLIRFLEDLYSWNAFAGFTRIPRKDAVRLHLLDSLLAAPELAGARTVSDLGTGAGVPGIPLAILLEEAEFTLVESRRRRCSFLLEVVRRYGLSPRVRVAQVDARDLPLQETRFDAVISRAFLPPESLLELGRQIIKPGGRVIVMATMGAWEGELAAAEAGVRVGLTLESERGTVLPGGSERRWIFCFTRQREDECFT